MKCFNCKNTISDVDRYCPRCGVVFKDEEIERIGNTIENQLLHIYLSKKRFNDNYSLGYLIFNFWYALYKKMYLEAAFGALADGLLIMMIMNWKYYLFDSMGFNALLIIFLIILGVAVNIYYILKFDELYIDRTKGYINKLIKDYGPDDMEFLVNKCERDSKGNLFVPCLVIVLVLMFFLALILKNVAFLSFCGII
ncbi:MAG: hypothetical protein IJO43_01460 [Bacilli bacterium]|nr:hypothetical protein [Bacilli bacterium]